MLPSNFKFAEIEKTIWAIKTVPKLVLTFFLRPLAYFYSVEPLALTFDAFDAYKAESLSQKQDIKNKTVI